MAVVCSHGAVEGGLVVYVEARRHVGTRTIW